LLKLRGALDVFALGDSQNLLKLKPEAQSFDAIIDALQIANEGLLDAGLAPDPLSVTNQIPFIDQNSERQVLRRTLLASATRLTDPYPQLMQRRFLEYFRANLEQVDLLVAIGCSMSDAEVNEIIQEWLASSAFRRLEIVAPRIQQVPADLEPVASQITLTPASTTTYLEQFG
jgi:predicted CopG family antitoxin